MYCSKCGKYIDGDQFRYAEDGQILCVACAEQASGAQANQPEFSVGGTPAPKKNKKTGLIAAIAAIAVVAVAAIAIFLNFDAVENFWNSTFAAPEEYMISVEDKALSEMVDTLTSAPIAPSAPDYNGGTATAQITLSEQVLALVDTALAAQGMEIDHSFLSDIRLKLDTSALDEASSTVLALLLGDRQILSLHNIVSGDTSYVAIPEINETYLSGTAIDAITENAGEVLSQPSALSDGETVNDVLQRYIPTFLSALKDVTKTKETLELNGVQQNVTALTAKITPEDLVALCNDLLDQLEADEEAMALFLELVARINPDMADEDPTELLADLRAYLEEAAASAPDAESNYLLLTTYVDSVGEVAGRKFAVYEDGSELSNLSYISVDDKDTTHRSLTVDGEVLLDGSGSETEGTYNLYADSEKVLSLEYRDYVFTEEALSGTFVLTPHDDSLAASTLMLGGAPTIEISINNTATNVDVQMAVKAGDNALVSVKVTGEGTTVDSIEIPTDTADVEDEDAMTAYFEGLDFTPLLDNLKAANVPEELVSAVEALLYSALYGF